MLHLNVESSKIQWWFLKADFVKRVAPWPSSWNQKILYPKLFSNLFSTLALNSNFSPEDSYLKKGVVEAVHISWFQIRQLHTDFHQIKTYYINRRFITSCLVKLKTFEWDFFHQNTSFFQIQRYVVHSCRYLLQFLVI